MQISIQPLTGISLTTLSNAFNAAFIDYIIPLTLSEEALQSKIHSENIQLAFSAGVFDHGKLIGFVLTGIDENDGRTIAYNAGTGVAPAYRGNKLTERMYAYLIPLLSAAGIAKHQLEVITTNEKALSVYKKIGFAITRKLGCFKGRIKASDSNPEIDIKISDIEIIDASLWDSNPAYQNSTNAIRRDKENLIFLSAFINTIPAGYIVFSPGTGRVKQFGVYKKYRRSGVGSAMFSYVQDKVPGKELSVINIDSADLGTHSFLVKIGFLATVEQYEMQLISIS